MNPNALPFQSRLRTAEAVQTCRPLALAANYPMAPIDMLSKSQIKQMTIQQDTLYTTMSATEFRCAATSILAAEYVLSE